MSLFGISQEDMDTEIEAREQAMRDYGDERDRRIRAEAASDELRLQVEALSSTLAAEQDKHARQIANLIDRALPRAPAAQGAFVGDGAGARVTSQDILNMPAIGRRGVRERQHAYRHKVAEETKEKVAEALEERKETLTPEELAQIEFALTGDLPPRD